MIASRIGRQAFEVVEAETWGGVDWDHDSDTVTVITTTTTIYPGDETPSVRVEVEHVSLDGRCVMYDSITDEEGARIEAAFWSEGLTLVGRSTERRDWTL